MKEIATTGLDLAQNVFQVHGGDAKGIVLVRRQVRRAQVLVFFSRLPPCLVGREACAEAHCRSREPAKLGHDVRLIPPFYVKPFVKRGKTDADDAEAIREAVTRPNMRFVPVRTERRQAVLMQHRTGDFPVRRLTQLANALRAHLGKFGIGVPKGVPNMGRLIAEAEAADLPPEARMPLDLLAGQFRDTKQRIDVLTGQLEADAEKDQTACRLQTVPGIGPLTASVRAATLPDVSSFRSARDLPAWLDLAPKPHSSAGKERPGSISRMGNRHIRRLLYPGAMGVICARKRSGPGTDRLGRLIAARPLKVAAIALANRMARAIRAMSKTGDVWRPT